MAYFTQSLVKKNEESCDEDGDICSSEESTIDNGVTGSNVAQRIEQVDIYI
jgi:hypothetical protein